MTQDEGCDSVKVVSLLLSGLICTCAFLSAGGAAYCQEEKNDYSRLEIAISAFEKADKELFPVEGSMLFVGSSSIRAWKTLAEDMAPHPAINRGFGGSQIDDCVHFTDRIVIPYKPSAVVLYAGDNDIAAGKTPERVLEDFKRFAAVVRGSLPGTPLYFLSIKPSYSRWSIWPNMLKANRLIERYIVKTENLVYIDVSSPMLDKNGNVRRELFIEDDLHMSAKGYRLWTSIVKPRLDAIRDDYTKK